MALPDPSSTPPPSKPGAAGIGEAFASWRRAATTYTSARIALFQLEAREAGAIAGRRLAAAITGAVLVAIAYPMLWIGIIGMVETARPGSWPVATLIAGGLHLIPGLLLLASLRKAPATQPFAESLRQWKTDQAWLASLLPTKAPSPAPDRDSHP